MTDEQTTAAPAAGPSDAEQRPPLSRSERHRVVAGVCGGLGRHLDIDPVVFRVVTAVLCLSGGLGLFLYGLAWLIVPREAVDGRPGRTELQRVLTGRVDGQSVGAVLLTVIGTGVFFSSMGDGGQLFPLLLLGCLVFLAVRYDPERRRHGRGHGRRRGPGGPYDRPAGGVAWKQQLTQDFLAGWQERAGGPEDHLSGYDDQEARERHARARADGTVPADSPPPGPSGYLWDPRHPERNPYGARTLLPGVPVEPWWKRTDLPGGDPLRKPAGAVPDGTGRAPETPVARRPRSFLAPLGLLLAAGGGSLAWWSAHTTGHEVRISTVLAAALLGLGLPLLLGAKFGRARSLTVPALLLTLALAGTAQSGATVGSVVGDRAWRPTATGLHSRYTVGVGDGVLDLTGVDPAGGTLTTSVRSGIGSLRVVLPGNVEVRLTVRNGVGTVNLPDGQSPSGIATHQVYRLHPVNGQASKGTLDLTLTLGIGDVQVNQS